MAWRVPSETIRWDGAVLLFLLLVRESEMNARWVAFHPGNQDQKDRNYRVYGRRSGGHPVPGRRGSARSTVPETTYPSPEKPRVIKTDHISHFPSRVLCGYCIVCSFLYMIPDTYLHANLLLVRCDVEARVGSCVRAHSGVLNPCSSGS